MTTDRKYLIHIFPINSPWGVIKHPIKGNIYKHTPLVSPAVKDYYVKKKLNQNKDINWANVPNFHIEFIDEVSFYFNRKYDDYTNMDELLASDYCVVKKPDDKRLYYYTLSVDKQSAGSVRFLATLDILFTYHPSEYLSPTRQSFIKQGHEWRWNKDGTPDWKKVLKNNEPIVSIDKTHKIHSLIPENVATIDNYSKGYKPKNVKWVVLYIKKGQMSRVISKISFKDSGTDLPIDNKILGLIKTYKGEIELPYTIFLFPLSSEIVYIDYPFYDNPVSFNVSEFLKIIENLGDIIISIHLKNFNDLGVDSANLLLSTYNHPNGVKYPLIVYNRFKPLYLIELKAIKPNSPEKGVDISNYQKWIGTADYDKYIKPILKKHGVSKDNYENSDWDFINMGVLMATPLLAGAGGVAGALRGVNVLGQAGNTFASGASVAQLANFGNIASIGSVVVTGSSAGAVGLASTAILTNIGTSLAEQLEVSKGKGGGDWDFSIFCGKGGESNKCMPLNSLILVGEYFKYLNNLGHSLVKTKIFIPFIERVRYLVESKPFKGKFIPLYPRSKTKDTIEKEKDPIVLHPNYYQLDIKKWNSDSISYSYPYLVKDDTIGITETIQISPTTKLTRPKEYGKPLSVNIMYSWQPANDSSFIWLDYDKKYKNSLIEGDYLQLNEQKTIETSQDPLQAYLRDNKNSFNTTFLQQQASISLEKRRAETSRDFSIGGGLLGFLGGVIGKSPLTAIGSGLAGTKEYIGAEYDIESANMRLQHLKQTRQATLDDYKNRLAKITTGEVANADTIIRDLEPEGDEIKVVEKGLSPANESILLNEVNRHGYNVVEHKNVLKFINTRERFNYIESDGIFNDITLKLSSKVKQVINDTFADGITFWHYRTQADIDDSKRDIKEYNLSNDEKTGSEPWLNNSTKK